MVSTQVAPESTVLSMVLSVIKDTYVEALIIAVAMVFYMRIAKLCEPHFWRAVGYKDVATDSVTFTKLQRRRSPGSVAAPAPKCSTSRCKPQSAVRVPQSSPVADFFAALASSTATKDCREMVDKYEHFVRVQREDLAEQLSDRSSVTTAFAAIAEAMVQVADVSAKPPLLRLLSDMRTFGFPRNREIYSVIVRALVNRQFVADLLWAYDVMVADGCPPDRTVYVCLLNAAMACGQDQKAIMFFKEICKAGNPSMRTYMTVLRIFTKNNDWRGAVDTLEVLKTAGGEIDALALNTVLGICVAASRVDVAERLVKEWQAQADTISCNILLKGYAKSLSMDKAEAIFNSMLTSGPPPNVISFNTMMDCSVRAIQQTAAVWSQRPGSRGPASGAAARGHPGGIQRAWELLEQLNKLGLEPDRYTCSTLVKGMHLAGCTQQDVDRAVALIKRVDFTVPLKGDDSNVRLAEVLFNSLLDACVNLRDLDRMAEIFNVMEGCKVVVSAVTFGTLMKAFGQGGQLAMCHEVWNNMRKAQVRPTIVTYGCYIDACIRNRDIAKAQAVFESMASDGIKPNAVVYTTMIRGCAQAKQPLRALELYREMRRHGIEPTAVTFNSVLDVIARQLADTDGAQLMGIVEDMEQADVTPDAVTYSILMKASCNNGNVSDAIALFRKLRQHGIVFDEVAFNTLLMACSKADNVKEAEGIFDEMLADGTVPTLVTISILVKMYGKAKMLDKALAVSKMVEGKFGTKPNLFLFTCLVQACVRNRQLRKSWQVFGQMFTAGVAPDAIAYGTIIHGCVHFSKFEEAMALVRHAYAVSTAGQVKSLAVLLEISSLALGQRSTPVPLQDEVLQTLDKAMRRKGQHDLVAELEALATSSKKKVDVMRTDLDSA